MDTKSIKTHLAVFTLFACFGLHALVIWIIYSGFHGISISPENPHTGVLLGYYSMARQAYFDAYSYRPIIILVVLGLALITRGLISKTLTNPDSRALTLRSLVNILLGFHAIAGILYLIAPGYIDAGESVVAMLSLMTASGNQIYNGLEDPDLANTYYGPSLFLANSLFHKILSGSPVLASKLQGVVFEWIALIGFIISARKRFTRQKADLILAFLLTGLFPFLAWTFCNRADSLILSCALGGLAFAINPSKKAAIIGFAICTAIGVNSKITSASVFIGVFGILCHERGFRTALLSGLLSIVLFFLPFTITHLFNIGNYIIYLKLAKDHTFLTELFHENLGFAMLLIAPLLILLYIRKKQASKISHSIRWQSLFSLGLGLLLMSITASKMGSGFYHLMAFVPIVAINLGLVGDQLILKEQKSLLLQGCAYGWPLTIILLSLGGITQVLYLPKGPTENEASIEIQQIVTENPNHSIAMGYGEHDDYLNSLTGLRPHLFRTTGRATFNLVSFIEYNAAGIRIPEESAQLLQGQTYDLYVLPAQPGTHPFSAKLLEETGIGEAFINNYHLLAQKQFFQVWGAKSRFTKP